jgi:hypothetical protein
MPASRGALKYRYAGNRAEGEHLAGVPMTNLYEDDLALLPDDRLAEVKRSAIYTAVEDEPKGEAKDAAAEKDAKAPAVPASQNKTGAAAPAPKSAGGEKK